MLLNGNVRSRRGTPSVSRNARASRSNRPDPRLLRRCYVERPARPGLAALAYDIGVHVRTLGSRVLDNIVGTRQSGWHIVATARLAMDLHVKLYIPCRHDADHSTLLYQLCSRGWFYSPVLPSGRRMNIIARAIWSPTPTAPQPALVGAWI